MAGPLYTCLEDADTGCELPQRRVGSWARHCLGWGSPGDVHTWRLSSDPTPCGWAANPSSRWVWVAYLHIWDICRLQCRPLLALTSQTCLPRAPTHLFFADSLWLLAQKLCLTVQSLELRIVMLSPGDMFRDALCGHGDWKALLSIPVLLDVVPPQPKPHPIPSLPCPVLPSPRVWLLVGIPKELPVEKRRLEERDCSHAKMDSPTRTASTPRQTHCGANSKRENLVLCANICKTVSTPCKWC